MLQETEDKLALIGLVAAGVGLSPASASMRHLGRRGVVYRELTGVSAALPLVALTSLEPSARARELMRLATRAR